MDQAFERLQIIEADWPFPSPDGKTYYDDFYERMHLVSLNHVCASCPCVNHSFIAGMTVAVHPDLLKPLQIDSNDVPFSFLCGMECFDSQNITIDKLRLSQAVDGQHDMYLCTPCCR